MTSQEILDELKLLGSESYKRVLMKNHGVKEPFFGVKISDLKKIQKRIRQDYQLALDLYNTGNYDAMYLAGLIADDARMTTKDLNRWVKSATGGALAGSTVPWVAAGSPHGLEIALQWIDSPKPHIAQAGWSILSCLVTLKPDSELDLVQLQRLIHRVETTILQSPDLARYAMNNFLISVGSSVTALTSLVLETANRIGPVTADLGPNNCQIPFTPDYIRKVEQHGSLGKKRKTVKC